MTVLGIPQTPYDDSSLWAIRQQVVALSGRYDLITSEGDDNGIDFFIRAGQRYLDRILDIDKFAARVVFPLTKGNSVVRLERVRAVKNVYLQCDTGDGIELKKRSPQDAIVYVMSEGSPSEFSILNLRHAHSSVSEMAFPANFFAFSASDDSIDAIQIFPKADREYMLIVYGLFYSPVLSSNQSSNFWTVHYPEIFIQAVLLQLEKFMRNSEGVRDQLQALTLEVQTLDFDFVTQQIEGVDQMEG